MNSQFVNTAQCTHGLCGDKCQFLELFGQLTPTLTTWCGQHCATHSPHTGPQLTLLLSWEGSQDFGPCAQVGEKLRWKWAVNSHPTVGHVLHTPLYSYSTTRLHRHTPLLPAHPHIVFPSLKTAEVVQLQDTF